MIPKERILGVVLAGGLSRRMGGGDKGLREIGGQPLLARVIARLSGQVGAAIINANGDPTRFSVWALPVAADSVTGFAGPLAGVLAGLDWARANRPQITHIVTAAVDTPFFPADLVARLSEAAQREGTPLACAATFDPVRGRNDHPVFGLWPVALADDLRAALAGGLRKVVLWTDRHGCARAMFDDGDGNGDRGDPFFNVNTPEDMAVAQRIAEGERA